MTVLHIVQGGVGNGDKEWLEEAASKGWDAREWTVPKHAAPGDDVVIFVGGYGFFATSKIKSNPKPRIGWTNRYGAGLTKIELIEPAISLAAIIRKVPALTWANYPRSITTPDSDVAEEIRDLIQYRRTTRLPDLDDQSLQEANIDELRKVALLSQKAKVPAKTRKILFRARSTAIKLYVLRRANGECEGCGEAAPFRKADGSPYLEPHHTHQLSDDGPDHPAHVIALCPTCHRRAHHAENSAAFNSSLNKLLSRIETRR